MAAASARRAGLTPARIRPGTGRWLGVLVIGAGLLGTPLALAASRRTPVPMCFGKRATIVAEAPVDEGSTVGTDGNDVIVGTAGPDNLFGQGGNDLICSLGGDDIVRSGPGNDRISTGGGFDSADGGEGDDSLFGDDMGDELGGGPGNDYLFGGRGDDVLYGGDGSDSYSGGAGTDACEQHEGDRRNTCESDKRPSITGPGVTGDQSG
jgi:hypothetical protein